MSTKKTPSLASPLDAQEVKYRTPKSRKKERSVHDKELAEIARAEFWRGNVFRGSWDDLGQADKGIWRAVVRAVLEEAIYRVEAGFFVSPRWTPRQRTRVLLRQQSFERPAPLSSYP